MLRMLRIPQKQAPINRPGFNNAGLGAFIANVKRSLFHSNKVPIGVDSRLIHGLNIKKNAATPIENATGDYLACLDGVYPCADDVAVKIASPNT
jgi:dihydroorotate dehydrogenase